MAGRRPGNQAPARLPPTNVRFELFESLRGIAALSVLFFHTAGWSHLNYVTGYGAFTSKLNVGLTLFFLISGFLLYRPYAVETFGGRSAPDRGDYALRRAFRILPAYWVALTALGLWPGLDGAFTEQWWVYYGLLQSYRQDWAPQGLAVAWSLSVEVAFYLLLPLLAAALTRLGRGLERRGRLRLQLLALGVLAVGSLGLRAFVHYASLVDLYHALPVHLLGFLVGMATAIASAGLQGREHNWRATRWIAAHPGSCWTAAAAGFAAVSLSPAFPPPFSEHQTTLAHTAESVIFSVIALLVMLPAVFGTHAGGLPRRLLRSRWLSWIGKVSYGTFLWHLPLVQAVQLRLFEGAPPVQAFLGLSLLIVPLSLGLGWLSWRFVEAPALDVARALGGRGTLAMADSPERASP